jgi:hypothetical protein
MVMHTELISLSGKCFAHPVKHLGFGLKLRTARLFLSCLQTRIAHNSPTSYVLSKSRPMQEQIDENLINERVIAFLASRLRRIGRDHGCHRSLRSPSLLHRAAHS